jgi:dihydrofolate reductase
MRKIIASVHITLDGILSGPAGDENNMISWAMPGVQDSTPDFQKYLGDMGTILLGRTTYEGLSQFWPTAEGEFADLMNLTPKIIFSRGDLKEVKWGNFDTISLINNHVEDEVRKIKAQPGKDMMIFASSKLVQNFTSAGLIDEYRIVVHPVILGSGLPLFENIEGKRDLKLKSVTPYPSGAVLIQYGISG